MDTGDRKSGLWYILEELQNSNEDDDDLYDNTIPYDYINENVICPLNTNDKKKVDLIKTRKKKYQISDVSTGSNTNHLRLCGEDENSESCQPKLQICIPDVIKNSPVKPGSSPKLEYQRGSLVWAKVPGYPSWPAMIDDDPDYSSFFWIDEASSPIQYHVVFFDADKRVSRFWCIADKLKPFDKPLKLPNISTVSLARRFEISLKEARKASLLSREKRLKKYAFILRLKSPDTKLCED